MVALRKAGLNNKNQRGESRLVSCFISTSNALAMEHPGYLDMKGWGKGKTKSRLSSQQYSQILSYKYMFCCVSKDRPAGMIQRGLSLKMVTTHHATSMSSQGGGRSSVGVSRSSASIYICSSLFLLIIIISYYRLLQMGKEIEISYMEFFRVV